MPVSGKALLAREGPGIPEPRRRSTGGSRCNLATGRPGLGCRPLHTASRHRGRPARTDPVCSIRGHWGRFGGLGLPISSVLQFAVVRELLVADALRRVTRRSPSRMASGGGSGLAGSVAFINGVQKMADMRGRGATVLPGSGDRRPIFVGIQQVSSASAGMPGSFRRHKADALCLPIRSLPWSEPYLDKGSVC